MSKQSRQRVPARSSAGRGRTVLLASAAAAATLFPAFVSSAQAAAPPSAKPLDPQLINVKFRDDTHLEVSGGRLDLASADAQVRLDKLLGAGTAVVAPLVSVVSPATLDERRDALQQKGKDVPDLTSWVRVKLAANVDPQSTIAKLRADPLVEQAYQVPKFTPTALTSEQQSKLSYNSLLYLGNGPSGLNVWNSSSVPGALGDNVDVVDFEYNSNPSHEELSRSPATVDQWYQDPGNSQEANHGTMVEGVIAAKRDGNGIDGIAPNARVHLASAMNSLTTPATAGYNGANVMYAAYQRLAPGSVFLIELGGSGAMEGTDPAMADLIRTATAAGVITVEAADNSQQDYDAAKWAGSTLAPGAANETGAIIVGAGSPSECQQYTLDPDHIPWPARTRMTFSSYGSRVDIQGPGGCVAAPSAAFGGVSFGEYGDNPNNGYTHEFNGTSSASAAIAGAVAALSGAYQAKLGVPLTPALARTTLKNPAYSQPQDNANQPGHVGPLPNLTAAINAIAVADTTAPSQPGVITPVNNGTSVGLSWGASTDAVGVTHYDVTRNGAPLEQVTGTTFTDPKTVPGTTYSYAVYAVDRAGNRSTGRSISVTAAAGSVPTDATIPTGPTALTASPDGTTPNTKINLSWSGATDNAALDHYEVRRSGLLVGTSTGSTFADTTVKPGTYYRYQVVAVDAAGNRSAPSVPRGVVTGGPRGDVIAPTNVGAATPTASGRTVSLSWPAASDAVGGVTYEVMRGAAAAGSYTVLDQTAGTSYLDTAVASNTTYYYRVVAIDAAGNRSTSTAVPVTTATFSASTDTTAPSIPGGPSVILTSNQPYVSWTSSTDNVGIARYIVRKNGLYVASPTMQSYTDGAAVAGRYATYSVFAQDAAGNRSSQGGGKGIAPTP